MPFYVHDCQYEKRSDASLATMEPVQEGQIQAQQDEHPEWPDVTLAARAAVQTGKIVA